MTIPHFVDRASNKVAKATTPFIQTGLGKVFLSLVLFGPLTFLPTIYCAWTAPNIDSFRTLTWPLMIVVNTSATLGVIHNGNWQMRVAMILWTLVMAAIFLATIVR